VNLTVKIKNTSYFVRTCILILLLAFTVSVLVGCDNVTTYRVLCFFFEEVPLPPELVVEVYVDPNSLTEPEPQAKKMPRHKNLYKHTAPCASCHKNDYSVGLSALITKVPNLCFKCHKKFDTTKKSVHGPVAVGDCLFCHHEHQSKHRGMVRIAEPDLCLQCHLERDMTDIGGHENPAELKCSMCHLPHTSEHRKLLKTDMTSSPESK
jgi:predicted CXXCH cytochrome family protein